MPWHHLDRWVQALRGSRDWPDEHNTFLVLRFPNWWNLDGWNSVGQCLYFQVQSVLLNSHGDWIHAIHVMGVRLDENNNYYRENVSQLFHCVRYHAKFFILILFFSTTAYSSYFFLSPILQIRKMRLKSHFCLVSEPRFEPTNPFILYIPSGWKLYLIKVYALDFKEF